MLSEMPRMKKGKIIVMPPQNQNYFILLIDGVGGGGVGGEGAGCMEGRVTTTKKKCFSAKKTFNLLHARVSMSLLIFPQKYSASQLG